MQANLEISIQFFLPTPSIISQTLSPSLLSTDRWFSVIVLGLSLHLNGGCVLHNPLDRHLDELVKRVQLLTYQSFLIKV